jgi:F0F1-type ATP synthase membrane subunit c/vacuolar-type H+-ATPase subunit K
MQKKKCKDPELQKQMELLAVIIAAMFVIGFIQSI